MLEVIREIWSNPTQFCQKRTNLRKLLKWYKFSSGNFCKCSHHDTSEFFDVYTWSLILVWAHLYLLFWMYFIWGLNNFLRDAVKFNETCNNSKLISWYYFSNFKHGHNVLLQEYSFNQTRKYGQFLSAFDPKFRRMNRFVFVQNQMYYECATTMGIEKFEELLKAKYCEHIVPPFLYHMCLRMAVKCFVISYFQNRMPRKQYFYVKFGFFILDLLVIISVVHICLPEYIEMVLNFETDIQMIS